MPEKAQKLSREKMYMKDNVYVNPLAPELSALHTLQTTCKFNDHHFFTNSWLQF